jgi:hypothetical protein
MELIGHDSAMAKGQMWPLRVLLLVVAVVVCAWFALGIRQAHDTASASSSLSSSTRLTAAQAKHLDSILDEAGFLNPDREVSLLRAQVARQRRQLAKAQSIILQVVHDEPLNVEAWFALGQVATNSRTYLRAVIEVGRLAPQHH